MAELTFKSPGVSLREIDLSGPTAQTPQGTPAGVIGTSQKGRAFVPITVATYRDFVAEFGLSDGERFGPLAMFEWMRSASAGTYVRVLGAGNGEKRTTAGDNTGKVTNAGFVVGDELVQNSGLVGPNPYAGSTASNPGVLGRTYFLGAFHSGTSDSDFLAGAGIDDGSEKAHPIIRGVLMTPSGVVASLSSSYAANNQALSASAAGASFGSTVGTDNAGAQHGTVLRTNGDAYFTLLLNGHRSTPRYSNSMFLSFSPDSGDYFAKKLNTDPLKIEEAGHYLYTHWDVDPAITVVTGTGIQTPGSELVATQTEAAFILTGSGARDTGTTQLPNYDNFSDRFRTGFSPWVISQRFGGKNKNLFKIHALDDGTASNGLFKITIENLAASTNENNPYGTFDLLVRRFNDTDEEQVVLESYRGLSLDPSSDRYIARVIGDAHIYYDFDQDNDAQKLRIEGSYPNASRYIRVEMASDVDRKRIDATALPTGFRGHHFLLTSGTTASGNRLLAGYVENAATHGITQDELARAVTPPVTYRSTLARGTGLRKNLIPKLAWGVQFEELTSVTDPNVSTSHEDSLSAFTRYFPRFHSAYRNVHVGDSAGTPDDGGVVLDSDKFQNALFTLENIQVATGSTDRPISEDWGAAQYRRDGTLAPTLISTDGETIDASVTRFLDPSKDYTHLPSKRFYKFNFFLQGGFDGVNIFDEEKAKLTDVAARREFGDEAQGKIQGPTISSYRKAIDILGERSETDIQLLAIPGIRLPAITDYSSDAVESRFDALYIMDIEEKDQLDEFMTGSTEQTPSVTNTVNNFVGRNLDTSFAAAYYPDVVVTDPATQTNVVVPPSVAVLGAFALNDTVAYPWFAPAGFTRGALASTIETQVKLKRENLDALYEADINPLTSFPDSSGVIVFGQKTLQAAQSALDRVNVRRLLIDIRRKVRQVANSFLFEPNRADTLARFSDRVNPILQQVQSQRGVSRYRVQIDTTTTTQADVENNTIRGKIYLQPVKSLEFISLDFVVTNQGAEI